MSIPDRRITNRATQVVKSDKSRFIRPVERQRMRPWLINHLDKNDIAGLVWQNKRDRIFRISWKHAANQCFNMEKDTNLFERWAIHTGRHQDSDHKRWKANFRCALNSLPDVEELKEQGIKKGNNAFKVYRFLDERESKTPKATSIKRKKEAYGDYMVYDGVVDVEETYPNEGEEEEVQTKTVNRGLPKLPLLYQPSTSGVDLLLEAESSGNTSTEIPVDMDNLQEILAAATASLAAGSDALALEKISIEQLSRLGEVSKRKLDIQRTGNQSNTGQSSMDVYLCYWCNKVYEKKVALFQHFLIVHQDKLLSGEEYNQEGITLQREIEDLEKKVLNFTRETFKKEDVVIEDGTVTDINTTNVSSTPEVYIIEDEALDLSVTSGKPTKQDVALDLSLGTGTKRLLKPGQKIGPKLIGKKRRSSAKDMDYIVKFGNYGLAGAPQTKRQMSLLKKKKEEEEKAKKSGGGDAGDADPSKQHSMEDLVHAKILISLKSAPNEDEDGEKEATKADGMEGTVVKIEVEDPDELQPELENEPENSEETDDQEDMEADESDKTNKATNKKTEDGNCKKKAEGKKASTTQNKEHAQEYMCRMCHNIFEDKDMYVTHLESHFPPIKVSSESGKSSGKSLTCDVCKETGFESAKSLEAHNRSKHYTVIPMKVGNKEPMTLVVHPSSSIMMSSVLKGSKKEVGQKTAKSKKPTQEAETDGEEKTEAAEGKKGDKTTKALEGKSQDTDSVDGISIAADKDDTGKTDKETDDKEAKETNDPPLPAFSEIVKDVDEFFIKDVKPGNKAEDDGMEEDGDVPPSVAAAVEVVTEADTGESEEQEMEVESEEDESQVSEKGDNECIICNKHFSDKAYYEHMKMHSVYELAMSKIAGKKKDADTVPTVFGCGLCDETYCSFDDLKKHVTNHVAVKKTGGKGSTKGKAGAKGRKRRLPIGTADVLHKLPKLDKNSSASILAAALKTGPKFNVTAALTEGTSKTSDSKMLQTIDPSTLPKNVQLKLEVVRNASDPKSEIMAAVRSIEPEETAKETLPASSVTATTTVTTSTSSSPQVFAVVAPGVYQNFASKLLVQGMQTFLLNSTQAPVKGVLTTTPSAAGQVRPPMQILNKVEVSQRSTAHARSTHPITVLSSDGKATILPTELKSAPIQQQQQQQVFVLKPNASVGLNTMPVQVVSSIKNANTGVGVNTLPLQVLANTDPAVGNISFETNATPKPTVSLSKTILTQTTTPVPHSVAAVQSPTVQVPVSIQSGGKIALPLSVLQSIPGVSLSPALTSTSQTITLGSGGSMNVPIATNLPVVKAVPISSAMTKVNPAIQNNLLNMVLARMSQPGSVTSPGAPITINLAASLAQANTNVSASIASPQISKPTASESALRSGMKTVTLPLFMCKLCRKQGSKIEMMSHVCGTKTNAAPVLRSSSTESVATNTLAAAVNAQNAATLAKTTNDPKEAIAVSGSFPAIVVNEKGAALEGEKENPKVLVEHLPTALDKDSEVIEDHPTKYFLNIYECFTCKFSSMKKVIAEKHMQSIHNQAAHECKYELSKKTSSVVKDNRTFECKQCGMLMSTIASSQPMQVIEAPENQHLGRSLATNQSATNQSTNQTTIPSTNQTADQSNKKLANQSSGPIEMDKAATEVTKTIDDKPEDHDFLQLDEYTGMIVKSGSNMFKCPFCHYWFVSELEAKLHMENSHSNQVDEHVCAYEESINESDTNDGSGKSFDSETCRICGLIKKANDKDNMNEFDSEIEETVEKVASDKSGESVVASRTGPHECKDCNLTFDSPFKLKQHKVIRHGRAAALKRHSKAGIHGSRQQKVEKSLKVLAKSNTAKRLMKKITTKAPESKGDSVTTRTKWKLETSSVENC